MTQDLLPCPFCGGPALFGRDGDGAQGVGCKDCGAGTRAFYPLMDDARHLAAEAWNRRASLASQPAADLTELASSVYSLAQINNDVYAVARIEHEISQYITSLPAGEQMGGE